MDTELVGIKEAAAMLGVCKGTINNLIRRGWLPSVKIGGAVRVSMAAIRKAIKAGCGPQGVRPSQFRKRGKKGRFVSKNLAPLYQAYDPIRFDP